MKQLTLIYRINKGFNFNNVPLEYLKYFSIDQSKENTIVNINNVDKVDYKDEVFEVTINVYEFITAKEPYQKGLHINNSITFYLSYKDFIYTSLQVRPK